MSGRVNGITVGSATHRGLVRKENEDAIAVGATGALWAVADGMGGHARGAWAASTIAHAIDATITTGNLHADCERVADVLADANDLIVAEGTRGGGTIGSTVVALLLAEGRYACLWAGDSRIYLLRGGALRQLTRDHSQVEELVSAGVLTREQARDHPLGNVVTRAIGVAPGLAIDVAEDAAYAGDLFLLCSDGLTKVIEDDELPAMLSGASPQATCDTLVEAVLQRGAPDNVSVVLVRIG